MKSATEKFERALPTASVINDIHYSWDSKLLLLLIFPTGCLDGIADFLNSLSVCLVI